MRKLQIVQIPFPQNGRKTIWILSKEDGLIVLLVLVLAAGCGLLL